jgi:hypothetical protein
MGSLPPMVQAKFQNLKLKLVGSLRQWTHHQVTRS